jgi:LuxR family transcriptional regulator, quorum-sensing system regulator SdiA
MERASADHEGRASRDSRDRTDGLDLTVEERRALALSASGLGVAAIAEAVNQSSEMVRQSLESVRKRLGARSKLEAVIIGVQRGLIDPLEM